MKPGKAAVKRSATKAAKLSKPAETNFSAKGMLPWYLAIFLFSFLLYSGTIGHKYVLDDSGVIEKNWVVKKGLTGIPLILSTPYRYGVSMLQDNLYRPLSLAMFAVEWQLAPGNPMPGHLVNVLFYALTCALLLMVLLRIFHRFNPAFALFACLLWMVHPVHTEVVANIKSRDEIMSVFFLLLSVNWFISYTWKKSRPMLAASLGAFFLALMSKEGVITFLLVMPLIAWQLGEKQGWAGARITLLFLVPAILYLLIRQAVLNTWATDPTNTIVDNLLLAAPDMQSRLATAFLLLGKYLLLLVAPLQLVSDYSYNQIPVTGWNNPLVLLSLAAYAGILVYAVLKFRNRSFLVFGLIWFLVTISIYSNLVVLIGSSFAERFLYLPSIGFCISITALVMLIFRVKEGDPFILSPKVLFMKMSVPSILFLVIMVAYSFQTVARNRDWKDGYTLFSRDVERSPNSAHMRMYWGKSVRDKAKEEKDPGLYNEGMRKALEEFKKAASIYPSYAEAWQEMGLAYYRLKDDARALESYQKALSLNPGEPTTFVNMGIIFFQKGNYQRAIELYQKAISLDPNYADAYFNLASSLGMTGDFTGAVENFKKCLALDPDNALASYYLGITYRSLNNVTESQRYLDRAAQLDPALGSQGSR